MLFEVVAALCWLLAAQAAATCNVIPSVDRIFRSELGAVSRPFARPGDVVVILREGPEFSADPAENVVRLEFVPRAEDAEVDVGPVATLPPADDTLCPPSSCTASGCRCIRFAFPDTDAQVGAADDRRTLTGPVRIVVRTRGAETARIGPLQIGDTAFRDELFPHFVGLPPANRFVDFRDGPQAAMAAEDTAGNLFVPLDFTGIIPDDERRTRFLDATIPGLGSGGSVQIDVFTVAGQRLPPLVRQPDPNGDELLGTADTRESVFRIAKGSLRPGLVRLSGAGPVLIPKVTGTVEATKQADPGNMVVNQDFAVYEARECDLDEVPACGAPAPIPAQCVDLNHDGDASDYVLYALDLRTPHATPRIVDQVDGCDFAGYPNPAAFPSFGLYSFSATDDLVAFRIVEGGTFDIDGNGHATDVLRTGAFDLRNDRLVPEAAGSPRQEVAGSLLAFSQPTAGGDTLFWYDAADPVPQVYQVSDGTHPQFRVTRRAVGADDRGRRRHPFDFAVGGGRLAFVVPEAVQNEDLTGDGDRDDGALLLFDRATGAVTRLFEAMARDPNAATLALTPSRLAFQTERGTASRRLVVGVRDPAHPAAATRLLCDGGVGGPNGVLSPAVSDGIVPCLAGGPAGLLHVLRQNGVEQNLGLHVAEPGDVQVSKDVLAVGIDESVQAQDLDGDGKIEAGTLVLHTFNGTRGGSPTDFRRRLVRSTPPFLEFIARGLVVLSAGPLRSIFRDVDGDGIFEEPVPDPVTGVPRIADNCPTIPNTDQRDDGNSDGIGAACKCPVLLVDTVRAFAGSHVRVPVDLEPGPWKVASTSFTLDYSPGVPALAFQECRRGPIAEAARASASCGSSTAGMVPTFVDNPAVVEIPPLGQGELVSYELAIADSAQGATFAVCVDPGTVAYGDTGGRDLVCPSPRQCGEVRVDPFCAHQGDCNCDGVVNGGDRVCLISKFFDPSLQGQCPCEDCNLSGRLNAADAPCITNCAFGRCVTER